MLTKPLKHFKYVGAFLTEDLGRSDNDMVNQHMDDLCDQWIIVVDRKIAQKAKLDVIQVITRSGLLWIASDFLNTKILDKHFPL